MRDLVQNIKKNSYKLLELSSKDKQDIILDLALALRANFGQILSANERDLAKFNKGKAMRDRLLLNETRLNSLYAGLENIAKIDDPIGVISKGWRNYAGLEIKKVAVPLGLICVIYEARPALSAELLALMIKSSNACIFKGGSESKNTNELIFKTILPVLEKWGLAECFLMLYERAEINELLKMHDLIDVVIPRGSETMIRQIAENTKIPLIKQDKGLCHIFVDSSADLDQAVKIIINAKCQKPSVCNALETLLVSEKIARDLFTLLIPKLEKNGVKIHAHKNAMRYFESANLSVIMANESDFNTEWLDLELSIKIVANLDEAIAHINEFSSGHSESILSNDAKNIAKFQSLINSACVYANASTRFSDGGEFGFGGEVGISTSKLHARGPMGVNEICSYKYLITGNGQIR